ncbi:MAG: SDR family oxidoreductase, partial [Chloroflexi bacterium]|nr:SDR family oxidoreductase [Chloroflexota bacterium]
AIVTGGSRGIGRATALQLARDGANVVVNYRREDEQAQAVAREIEQMGRRALLARADLENEDEIRAIFEQVRSEFGFLDILVANAAASAFRQILDLKSYNLDRTFAISLHALVLMAQEAVPLMLQPRPSTGRTGGRIVAVSGFDTIRFVAGHATLAAAKAGLETYVRYLAVELADLNVNVNSVCPGLIESDSARTWAERSKAITGEGWEEQVAKHIPQIPRRRLGQPEDIANLITFLCSDEGDYICGQNIVIDGGLTIV